MAVQRGNLADAVSELERALADNGPDRDRLLADALANLEEAARAHALEMDPHHGQLVDVDRPLLPSPGVTRQVSGLRQELGELVADAAILRDRLTGAGGGANPAEDYSSMRDRARKLAEDLERFNEQEARLIQDSVTTDLGAGD
jgi:hypothetical protein